MQKNKIKLTLHCPFCDSENVKNIWIGNTLTRIQKTERFCNDCKADFKHKDIIVKTYELIKAHKMGE